MPIINTDGTGQSQANAAQTSFEQLLTISADTDAFSLPLLTRGMPRVQFYVLQLTGAQSCKVTPQFSIADSSDGTKSWNDLTTALSPLGSPILLAYDLSCKFVRLKFSRFAGQSTQLKIVIMAAM